MIKKALLGKITIPREGGQEGPTTKRLKSGGEWLERRTGTRKPQPCHRAAFAVPATEARGQEQNYWSTILRKSVRCGTHPGAGC